MQLYEIVGSPEWFGQKAKDKIYFSEIERWRKEFNTRFAPSKLADMDGKELLNQVFDGDDSMLSMLMFNKEYRWFGAAGEYTYLKIIYHTQDGKWIYNDGKNHNGKKSISITLSEAESYAVDIRNQLLKCIDVIENIGEFKSINDYETLTDQTQDVFFSKYAWTVKYYQMLFPQYFPGMYSDNTILRALNILGLPNHGKGIASRLLNAGELSLFIRKCKVNNIVFNKIYEIEWGWVGEKAPCEYASKNYVKAREIVTFDSSECYPYKYEDDSKINIADYIEQIENEVNSEYIKGDMKEAVIKVRINQGFFRDKLIAKYNKCCLCGVKSKELLIASHIKPWVKSDPIEKTDENNGLLLCPNHDRLFDKGYISFTDDGNIIISSTMDDIDRVFTNINEKMAIKVTKKMKDYLQYHRENILK